MIASGTTQKFSKLLIKKARHTIAFALTSFPDAGNSPFLRTELTPDPHHFRMHPPLNILLAEDERAVAFSVAFALKCDGHKVQVVADGEQALASVRVEPDAFNLLITDHSMPGMTGIELVERFREISFRGKIMVLSAHLSAEYRAAYAALGVDAMVSKPFDVHELRATVTRLANGIESGVGDNPISPTALHNMLESALEPDEPDEVIEGGS